MPYTKSRLKYSSRDFFILLHGNNTHNLFMQTSIFKTILSLLYISILLLFSCKRINEDITGNEDEEGIDQLIASEQINTVESNESAHSVKKEGEFSLNETSYSSAEILYTKSTDTETTTKIELLINGPTIVDTSATETKILAESSAFSWLINSANSTPIADKEKHFYIFYLDGKYYEYNNATKSAGWGYYYLDTAVTTIGLDYSNSTFQKTLSISSLTNTSLMVVENETEYEFQPYEIEGVKSNYFTPKVPDIDSDTTTTP